MTEHARIKLEDLDNAVKDRQENVKAIETTKEGEDRKKREDASRGVTEQWLNWLTPEYIKERIVYGRSRGERGVMLIHTKTIHDVDYDRVFKDFVRGHIESMIDTTQMRVTWLESSTRVTVNLHWNYLFLPDIFLQDMGNLVVPVILGILLALVIWCFYRL